MYILGECLYTAREERKTYSADSVLRHTVCPVTFNCGYPLSPNHDLRAGGSGAGPLVSAGLSMSSLCWLDDFHVSSHNLFR